MPLFGCTTGGIWDNGTAAAVPILGGWITTPIGVTTSSATTTTYYSPLTQSQTTCTTAAAQAYVNHAMVATNAATTGYWPLQTTIAGIRVYETNGTWYYLEQDMTPDQYMALAQARVVRYHARTEEEQRQLAERQRIATEEHQRRQAAYQLAATRSRELLVAHLTKEQLRTFEKNQWFVVEGGRSKQRYRIRDGFTAGNIDVLQGERVTHRLCCHCLDHVPIYDHLLAQKLHLQYDEDRFLQLANRHAA